MHWNIEGVSSGVFGNKFENSDFIQNMLGHDIIALTETHCDEENQINLPGYFVWQKSRPKHAKAKKNLGVLRYALNMN